MADPAKTEDQNILPVQALFNLDNSFNTFIGQGQPFYATVNPSQSGLNITNSTINSTTIGATTPSTGIFTKVSTSTGTITTAPVGNTDIVNKAYVDAVAQGLNPKQAVKCATTSNITLSGLQTIDAYTTLVGDRVLVKNQTTQSENGIYLASASAWTRAADMNVWAEVPGAYTVILYGNQGQTGWVSTSADTGTINVTPIIFVQFSGNGTYFAGTGLSLVSNTFSITNTGVTAATKGSASKTVTATVNAQGQLTSLTDQDIAISGTQITSGLVSPANGGTGVNNGANTLTWNASYSLNQSVASGSAPTFTGTNFSSIPNAALTNSSITVNGSTIALGGSSTITAVNPFALTIGSGLSGSSYNGSAAVTITNTAPMTYPATGIANSTGSAWGTSYSTTGTGTVVALATSALLITPTLSGAKVDNAFPYFDFTTTAAPTYSAGRLWYDTTQDAIGFYDSISGNDLFFGREIQERAYNQTGLTIAAGSIVYISGQHSQFPTIALAQANSSTTTNAWGVANTAIANNSYGDVVVLGKYTGIDTHLFTSGDLLYLSETTAGGLTNVAPTGSNFVVPIGYCIYSNPSQGVISVTTPLPPVTAAAISGVLSIAHGGTNGTATPTAGAIAYGTGTAYAFNSAGTSGQVLTSGGSGAPTWTTPTAYATVTDDTTTNATRYPLFAASTSGNLTTEYTSSTKYQFNPSTGILTATQFSGSGAGLTSIPNSALNNSSVTIGSTSVALGATVTTFAGLVSVTSTTFVGALTGNASTATSATSATNATNVGITDDTTTNATVYPTWVTSTTGNLPEKTSSTKLKFNPSTGALTVSQLIIAP